MRMMDFFDARKVVPTQSPPVNVWGSPPVPTEQWKPDFADNEQIKQAFGVALGRGLDHFKAGMELFEQKLPEALWASIHWKNDPIVIASRDAYLKTLKKLTPALDKEELLHEVLAAARSAREDRDRVQFFKLYSEIAGFTGKVSIDASTNFNTNNNTMKITLVKPEQKTIQHSSNPNNLNTESKILNDELPIKLKLVGGSSK